MPDTFNDVIEPMTQLAPQASSLPPYVGHHPGRLRRLALDMLPAVGVSALAAIVIVLIAGQPERLFRELVYSVCIGALAFGMGNGVRLMLWDQQRFSLRQWLVYFVLSLVIAPLAHFGGLKLGAWLLGESSASLANYPSMAQMAMIVFTWMGLWAMTLLVRHREHIVRMERAHQEARLHSEVVERQAVQAQLRLMQAQIEPHMLFNTLANLQGLIALDPERAQDMLEQLIVYLRATLDVSRADTTTLGQEFGAMQAYLSLMQVRMGARLAYRCELPAALAQQRLPTMLLQPLIENAIIHGLEPKLDGGEVVLSARQSGETVIITIHDTGLGLGQGHAGSGTGTGVGVATTRERLAVLYASRAALSLAPAQPTGTLVQLTLPLETQACPAH